MDPREALRKQLTVDILGAARSLLGWELVHGVLRARIVEVEAYSTPDDPGCHAHRGKNNFNATMFDVPGTAYVYFTYGNHWMINVVGFPEGQAAAVLIRAAEPLGGLEVFRERRPKAVKDRDLLSGPGKLTAAFGISKALNGSNLLDPHSNLRLEPGEPPTSICTGTRIGLAPGKGDELPWRFMDAAKLEWVSRPLPKLSP